MTPTVFINPGIKKRYILLLIMWSSIISVFAQYSPNYIAKTGVSSHNLSEGTCIVHYDNNGNTLQAGMFGGTFTSNYVIGDITLQSTAFINGYISKINTVGDVEWAYTFGGNNQLILRFMKTDSKGNIIITGAFRGNVDFNPDPVEVKLLSGSTTNITNFVLKLDPNGKFLWVSTFGGISWDTEGEAIEVDRTDNIIIAGEFTNTLYYGNFNMSTPGSKLYCLKVNGNDGKLIWGKKYIDINSTFNMKIVVDRSNNIMIGTLFSGTIDIDLGPPTKYIGSKGDNDIIFVSLSTSGDYQKVKNFLINDKQKILGFLADSENNLLVVYSTNTNLQKIEKHSADFTKIIWSSVLPAGFVSTVALNSYNDIILTGHMGGYSTYDPSTGKYKTYGDGRAFVRKYSKKGLSLSEILLQTTGIISPRYIYCYGSKNQVMVSGGLLGKGYFDPTDSTAFISNDNKIENFVFRWNDMCDSIKVRNQTIHKCSPYVFADSLLTQSGMYVNSYPNVFGCLEEDRLNITISDLDAILIATQDNLFTTEKNASQYKWHLCDQLESPISTANLEFIPSSEGEFTLIVKDAYCADTSEVCLLFPQVSLLGEMEQKNLGRIVKLNNNGYGFAGLDDPINGGMVNVYRINENKKWELTQKISSPSGANTSFGYEISSDKDILLISEIETGSQNGICYLYQLKNGAFTLVTSFTGESGNDRILFGNKTEISDQIIAVSSPRRVPEKENGYVYLYYFDGTSCQFRQKISPPANDTDGDFGYSMTMYKKLICVSSPNSKISNDRYGVIHVFSLSNDASMATYQRRYSNPTNIAGYGSYVALSDQYFSVATTSGYFLYKVVGDNWTFIGNYSQGNSEITSFSLFEDQLTMSLSPPETKIVQHHLKTNIINTIPVKNTSVPLNSFQITIDRDQNNLIVGIPDFNIFTEQNGLVYIHDVQLKSASEDAIYTESQWRVFPNPANEILNIQSNTTEIKFLEIYHIAGHKIMETNKNEIDIKTLPPGMYLVRIMDKNQKWTWIDFIKM